MLRLLGCGALVVVVLFVAIQAVLYGRNHVNPPVQAEPGWDSPRTRELAVRVCYDCHSNETFWPWYASVAPVSWRIQRHVDEGRSKVNYSEWGRRQEKAEESAETVAEDEMPPLDYVLLHPEARLSSGERGELIRGLEATLGGED